MPLNLPVGTVTPEVLDELLSLGYRRSGDFVYRTQCPFCRACEPTRVQVGLVQLSRSLRRVLRRGDRELSYRWGRPLVDDARIELFNRHRKTRGLDRHDRPIDAEAYRSFLVESCCNTRELTITRGGQPIAVSIVDFGRRSLSAVYTYFEPDAGRYSLGTYAILKQIEMARQSGRRYLYLGMYVADNRHLNYKSRYTPQERLIGGRWVSPPAETAAEV